MINLTRSVSLLIDASRRSALSCKFKIVYFPSSIVILSVVLSAKNDSSNTHPVSNKVSYVFYFTVFIF